MKKAAFYLLVLMAFPLAGGNLFAQIAQRGSATTATTTSTSLTITKPAGVVQGDVMIVNIAQTGNSSTAPTSSGWTLINGANLGSSAKYGAVLYRVAGASEGSSYAFTLGSGVSDASGAMVAFSGVDTNVTFDVSPGSILVSSGSSTSVGATTITTASADAAVIMFGEAGTVSSESWSAWKDTTPGTLTELYDAPSADDSVGAAWATKTTAGATGAGAATLAVAARNGGILIALRSVSPSHSTLSPATAAATANGTSTQVITVQARNVNNSNLTTGGDTVVFSATAGTLGATTDNANGTYTATWTAPTSVGTGTATVTATLDGTSVGTAVGASNSLITLQPGAASKLVFTTSAMTVTAGVASGTITVQRQDQNGNPATNGVTTVNLTTSSSGGSFLSATGGITITSTNIVPNSSTASFLYGDTVAGRPTITNAATGLTSAIQTETISAAAASKLVFTTSPVTVPAGVASGTITVQRQDQFGNPTTNGVTTVNLTTSSSGGSFLSTNGVTTIASTNILANSSTASFLYQDTVAGSPTITNGATGLTSATQQETVNAALVLYTFGTDASHPSSYPSITNGFTASAFTNAGGVSAGVTTGSGDPAPSYGGPGWQGGGSKYFYFTITNLPGSKPSLYSLSFDTEVTENDEAQPPTIFAIYYVIGTGTAVLVTNGLSTGNTNWSAAPTINLSGISALQNIATNVTFQLVGQNADGANDGWWVDNVQLSGAGGKANPSVTAWPTASAITYGQTLASATLSGGSASVAGTFAFTTPSTAPGAGTASESVTFTPTDTTNYNTVIGSVSVTVNKQTPTLTAPTASAITYGQTLASSTLTGGAATNAANSASVAGSFAFTTPSTAPGIGTASQSVTFTPTDTNDYNTATLNVSVTVNAAPASKLVFTTSPMTLTAGVASGTITVQRQDQFGNPSTNGVTTINLTTSSSGGSFLNASGSTTITSTNILANSSIASFLYKDTVAGSPTITNAATGLTSATQTETVNPAAASELVFTTSPMTLTVGVASGTITVQRQDQFGNPSTNGVTTVNLTSSSGGGSFLNASGSTTITSTNILAGLSTASFLYQDTVAGSPTITSAATGLTSATQPETVNTVLVLYTFGPGTNAPTSYPAITNGITASVFTNAGGLTAGGFNIVTGGNAFVATGSGNPAPQYAAVGWDNNSGNTKYFAFTITNRPGTTFSLSSLSVDTHLSKDGGEAPTNFAVYYVIGTGTPTLVTSALSTGSTTWQTDPLISLSGIPALQNVSNIVTFQFVGQNASGPSDGWGVDNVQLNGATSGKASPNVTAWPTASAITYGQTLASSTLSGGSATPAGTFAFTTPSTAPGAGTASQSVTFTPTDTNDYNIVIGSVSVTVNKASPNVTIWPTASAITYGQTLASSTLSGGSATPAGTFAFTTPSTAPGVGTASQSVTFTPTDTNDYNTASSSVSVMVNKANPSVTVWPMASAITYGQTLASSILSGGSATPVGTFAFTTPSTAPGAGTANQSVTFTPTDTTDYNTASSLVSVTVNKANPNVTVWPMASAITYGQTLASSILSGGSATPVGTFAFTTPSTAPGAGTANQSVTFTPADTTDYNTAISSVSVTVNQANPNVTVWPTASAITYGQTLASSTLSGGTATPAGTFAFTTPSTAPGVGTASQSVTFTPADTTDYNTAISSVSVTVNQANPSVTVWPTASAITYGQTLASSTLSGGSATPAGTFAFTTPSTAPGAGTASQSVTFTPTDTTDYNTASSLVSVTVNKQTPTLTAPTASSITFGQTLASSSLTGGSAINAANSAPVAGSFAFTAPSTAPGVGTASQSVTFTPTDTTDYNAATVNVNVNAKQTSTLAVNNSPQTYLGSPLAAAITTLTPGTVSNVLYNGSPTVPTAAGTYAVTANFTPADTNDYSSLTEASAGNFVIQKATPVIIWNNPADITYGTDLDTNQLNAIVLSNTLTNEANTSDPTILYDDLEGSSDYGVNFDIGSAEIGNELTLGYTNMVPTVFDMQYFFNAPNGTTGNEMMQVRFYLNDGPQVSGAPSPGTVVYDSGVFSMATYSPPTARAILQFGLGVGNGNTLNLSTPLSNLTWTVQITGLNDTESAGLTIYDPATVPGNHPTYWQNTGTGWTLEQVVGFPSDFGSQLYGVPNPTPIPGTLVYNPTNGTVLSAGVNQTLSVTFTPEDTNDYSDATSTVSINVLQTAPVISVAPIASPITYGQTLASSILTGGAATNAVTGAPVAGSFAFTTPSTAPGAGTASQSVEFTLTDTNDYSTVLMNVSVTVNKATPTATLAVNNSPVTYDGTAKAATVGITVSSVSGTVANILTGGAATQTGAGTYAVTADFVPSDTADYNTLSGLPAGDFVIQKATPTATLAVNNSPVPYDGTAKAATVGITASSVPGTVANILTGGAATQTNVGTYAVTADFVPSDSADYNTLSGLPAGNFVIRNSTAVFTGLSSVTNSYGVTSIVLSGELSATGPVYPANGDVVSATINGFTVSGAVTNSTGGFLINYNDPSLATNGVSGSPYPITYNYAGNAGVGLISASDSSTVLVITQATPVLTLTASAITYGQTLAASSLSGSVATNAENNAEVAGSFAFQDDTIAPNAGSTNVLVIFTPSDTNDYDNVTNTVSVTVNKATPTATLAVNNSPVTYDGTAKAATVGITVSSVPGTVANILTGGAATQTGAGTYAVTADFVPSDTADYNTLSGLPAGDFVIQKATPTAILAVNNSPVTYDGTAKAATVGITVSSVPGTVANILTGGSATQTGAGTYAVTADFVPSDTADYNTLSGLPAGNFVIQKATPTATLAVNNSPVTYDGTAKAATVGITASSVPGTVANILTGGAATQTGAGTYAVTADFVPGDTTDYNTLSGLPAGNFVIQKATPTATLAVNNSPVTYDGTAKAATVGITVSSVPGTVANILTGGTATQTGAGTYAVTADFVPSDTADYNTLSGLPAGNFVIQKATPTATLAVNNSPVTYDGTAKAATVGITASSVPGTVANILTGGAATQTSVGTYAVTADFVPSDTTDYNTLSGLPAGNFVIRNATAAFTGLNSVTNSYGVTSIILSGELSATGPVYPANGEVVSATINGFNVNGTVTNSTGGFLINYNDPSLATNGVSGSPYPITYNYAGNAGIGLASAVDSSTILVITQATPVLTLTASAITYGQTLAASSLSGSVATNAENNAEVAGSFVFQDDTIAPDAGSTNVLVIFTPSDTNDYDNVTNTVSVTVNKATPTATLAVNNSPVTYDGTAKAATVGITVSSVPGTVANILTGGAATQTGAGTYAVTADFVPSDTADYNTLSGLPAGDFVIQKATPTATLAVNNSPVTYDGTAKAATVGITASSVPGTVANILTGGAATQTSVGTYAVTADFVPSDTADYSTLSGLPAGNFVIQNATAAFTGLSSVTNSYGVTSVILSGELSASGPVYPANGDAVSATINGFTVNGTVTNSTGGFLINYNDPSLSTNGVSGSPYPITYNYAGNAGIGLASAVDSSTILVITQATPVLTLTASAITYGQTLAASSLSGSVATNAENNAEVAGSFAFQDDTIAPNAGSTNVLVIFTPGDTNDYDNVTNTVSVTVNKATPTATLAVNNSPVTYDGTAKAATVGITVSSVPGTVANILTGGAVTQTGAGTYAVTADFVPSDTADYNTLSGLPAGNFVIQKATPTATLAVNNSPVTYDGTAKAATVGITASSVPGTVANILTGGAATQTGAGTYAVTADFVPSDTADYNTLSGLPAGDFVIQKATPTATLAVNNSPVTYDGTAKAATVGITASSVPGTVANILTGGAATQTSVGTYAVTADFVPSDTADYSTLSGLPAGNFVIQNATAAFTGLSSVTNSYGVTSVILSGELSASGPVYPANGDAVSATINGFTVNGMVTNSTGGFLIDYNDPSLATNGVSGSPYPITYNYGGNAGIGLASAVDSSTILVITQATPVLTLTASAITYGQTLAASSLSGSVATNAENNAEVAGSFAFQDDTIAPDAGSTNVLVIFTPSDTNDYENVTNTVSVTVNKATPTATLAVNNSPVTYDGTAKAATVGITVSSVPGTVANILTGGSATQTGAGTYAVTADFVPSDTADYNTLSGLPAGNFVIQKATPTATLAVNNSPVTYDGTAKAATVGITASSVPGTVANILTGGAATQTGAGTYAVTANFVPGDTTDYNTLSGLPAGNFVIQKATPTATLAVNNSPVTYDGTAKAATVGITVSSVPGTVANILTGGTATQTGAGTYAVTADFVPSDTADYNTLSGLPAGNFVIQKATPTATLAVNNSPVTYDGTAKAATVGITASSVPGTVANILTGGAATQTSVGTYAVTADFVPSDTTDYNTLSGLPAGNFVIQNATAAFTGLSSVTNSYGVTSIILSGELSAAGPVYPANGEVVSATINGFNVNGTVTNSTGGFLINYNDPSLATNGVSGSPYPITYNYAGNADLNAATDDSTTLTVTAAPVTVTATGPGKTYGTALTAGTSSANFITSGLKNSDTITNVTLTPDAAGLSATTPAGSAYVVTPSAATGGNGFLPANYNITYIAYTGTVSQAALTVTATGPTKTYGIALAAGTSGANFTASATQNGETVTNVTLTPNAAGLSATTAAGSAYVVTPSAATGANGFLAANYNIIYIPYNGIVSQASPAFSGLTGSQSINYGTAGITVGGTLSAPGLGYPASGETITVSINGNAQNTTINDSTGDFSFSYNPSAIPASVSAYTITYSFAGDANLSTASDASTTLTVNPKALSITAPTIAPKIYDGTATAGAVTVGTLSGFVGSQTVTVTATAAAYSSPNAGTYPNDAVTYVLHNGSNGGLAANYSLASGTATGQITQATVTITSGITANNRGYDGTTNATLTIGTVGFTGVIPQDSGNVGINTSGAVAYFANTGPGNNIPVTVTGLTLSGSAAGNYTLAPVSLTANIIQLLTSAYTITDADSGSATAGVGDALTITAVQANGAINIEANGNVTVTFSGLSVAPNGSAPTVSDIGGSAQSLGTPMVLFFTNGVASSVSGAGVLVPYDAQTASPHITDGVHTDASPGGSTVSITVSPGPDSAYRISATTTTPLVGAGDALALNIVDQYQNTSAFSGNKSITFGGLSAGPDGSLPTVNGTAFGTGTTISFSGGTAAATLVAHKVESGRLLTASSSGPVLTAAAVGGTAPTLSPAVGLAARLGVTTQPSTNDMAGITFATQPVIAVYDAYLNPIAGSTASISVSVASGTLSGTLPTNAINGVATFSNLSLTLSGTNTLTFSSSGLASTNSAQITVAAGPVAGLAWTTQPGGAVYNSIFGTSPVLATVDQYGNPTTSGLSSNLVVTITETSGPGTLSGTTNYNIGFSGSNGVVTCGGLSINAVSNNFVLTATAYLPTGGSPPVSGMAVWLDASDTNSVIGSSPVTQWNDKSTNKYIFNVPAGFGTITYSDTLNGRLMVSFPNGPALLTTNNAYSFQGNSLTLFCMVRHSANPFGGSEGPFSSTSGNNLEDYDSPGSWSIDTSYPPTARFTRDNSSVQVANNLTPGKPFIWEGADDGPDNVELAGYDDGAVSNVVTGVPGTQAPFNVTQLAVGARLGGTNTLGLPWNGDVAEVLLYNSYLSASQQAQIYSYLYDKWLGPGAPVSASTAPFTVSPAPITITGGITANNKTFDGTTNDTLTIGTVGFSGVFPQDNGNVSLNTGGAVGYFANAGPGNNLPVTVTGITLTGSAAGDYVLMPLILSASITPAPTTYSAFMIGNGGQGSLTAGVGSQLTIAVVDDSGTVVSAISSNITVTFSGLSAGPDGSLPTVTDMNGNPQTFGTPMVLNFVNGVASTANGAGTLVAHKAQTASPHITDGENSDASTGGSTISLTVVAGPDSVYRISAATVTPAAGIGDLLTLNLVDQYQNPSSTTGNKTITFGGLSTGPNGTSPTVNGTAFGAGTAISFTDGSASATLVATRAESGRLLTASSSGPVLSAASVGGAAPTLSPTAGSALSLGISTQPSATAIAGVAFAQQPVITVLDAYGNLVTSSSAAVNVSAAVGNVLGTSPINAISGVAAFSGLSLTNIGTNTLTFSSGGMSTNSIVITTQSAQEPLQISVVGGVVRVIFDGVPGVDYGLQRSTNLSTGAGWVDITNVTTSTNLVFIIPDTFPDIGSTPSAAFYRLLLP